MEEIPLCHAQEVAEDTPTWRNFGRSHSQCRCPWCPKELCSLKLLWAHCPDFDRARRDVASVQDLFIEEGINDAWWAAQPRCTAKTGWIIFDASDDPVAGVPAWHQNLASHRRPPRQFARLHRRVLHFSFELSCWTLWLASKGAASQGVTLQFLEGWTQALIGYRRKSLGG